MRNAAIVAKLRRQSLNTGMFDDVSSFYPDELMEYILAHIEHVKGYSGSESRLLNTVFHFDQGQNRTQLFQFYDPQLTGSDYQSISIGVSSQLHFNKVTTTSHSPVLNRFLIRRIGEVKTAEYSVGLHAQLQTQGISVCRLGVELQQKIDITTPMIIEETLLEYFEEIKGAVLTNGYWVLSDKILARLPMLRRNDPPPSSENCQHTRQFFANSPLFLEKFCYFKVKEITEHYKNPDKSIVPSTEINLSVLQQTESRFTVSEARLEFSGPFVTSIRRAIIIEADNVIEALQRSRWLVDSGNETCIRLADQYLEDSLIVKFYCNKIHYGVLSNELKLSTVPKGLNFWEALAGRITNQQAQDSSQMELVAKEFHAIKSAIKRKPELHPVVADVAYKTEGMKQIEFATAILENSLSIRGTLLNLPTGYGKTFIILIAIAQHYRDLVTKKPYLVIVPQDNVRTSWTDNVEYLNVDAENKSKEHIFGSRCRLSVDVAVNDKGEVSLTENQQIVMLTPQKLYNCVAKMLQPIEDLSTKATDSEFEKRLHEFKYPQLGSCAAGLLKGRKKVFSKRYFVIGDETAWTEAIDTLLADNSFQATNRQARGKERVELNKEAILGELQRLRNYQYKQLQKYAAFKQSFNGIILDESHSVLAASSASTMDQVKSKSSESSADFIVRDIVFDIAKTYHGESVVGRQSNRLVVASSATPWPNNLDELKLHLRFLYPKLLGQYRNLNNALFNGWKRFEDYLSGFHQVADNDNQVNNAVSKIDNENNDAEDSDEANDLPEEFGNQLGQSLTLAQLNVHYEFVQNQFRRWIRLLFKGAIKFEPPMETKTNDSTSKVLFVTCQPHDRAEGAKNKTILRMIDNFYSIVLGVRNFNSYPSDEDTRSIHGIRSSDLFVGVKQLLPDMLRNPAKVAFYVSETKDARNLAIRLADHYQESGDNFIGFFYNDAFVKICHKHFDKKYISVRSNTDKDVNLNCFNNIFKFDDFFQFLAQYFGFKPGGHDLLSNPTARFKRLFHPIIELFRNLKSDNGSKKRSLLTEFKKQKYKKSIITNLYDLCAKYIERNCDLTNGFTDAEIQAIEFLVLIIDLEIRSKYEIINFLDVLKQFSKYLPRATKNTNVELDYKDHFSQMKNITEHADNIGFDNNHWLRNGYVVFRNLILAYLYKIHRSTILIFGLAGIAGMRIDAAYLFLFSGAWTLGRLSQIEGRFGRLKGPGNQTLHCTIYMSVTNTSFEYKILQYYIKKWLYHRFIVSAEPLSPDELCLPLLLSNALGRYYEDRLASGLVIDDSVRQKITEGLREDHDEYLKLGPYDKALKIISDDVREELQRFQQLIQSRLPATIVKQVIASQDMYLDEESSNDITESWGSKYSTWIKLYALQRGMQQGNALEARAVITALIPEQEYTITFARPIDTSSMMVDTQQVEQGSESTTCLLQIAVHKGQHGVMVVDRLAMDSFFAKDDKTSITVNWSTFNVDEFYLELISSENPNTVEIKVEPIAINGHTFFATAILCGGSSNSVTHFWTYRLTTSGYYLCDDLHEKITFSPGLLSFPLNTRFIRFTREDRLQSTQTLLPKQLHNFAANCYVNASYQFVETLDMRTKIQNFIGAYDNIPHIELSDIEANLVKATSDDQRPKLIPQLTALAPLNLDNTETHAQDANWILIFSLPTRGCSPDLTHQAFVEHLNQVIAVVEALSTKRCKIKAYLIYGINSEQQNTEALQALTNQISQTTITAAGKVMTVLTPFLWRNEDKWGKIPPIGEMRNHCLKSASSLWSRLKERNIIAPISFISMDGDTKIVPTYLYRMWVTNTKIKKYAICTVGYEMTDSAFDNKDPLEDIPQPESDSDSTTIYWTRLANRISNNVNSKLVFGVNSERYFGYFSEPMIYVSPSATTILFATVPAYVNEKQAPFGFWNGEGRRFQKYVMKLIDQGNLTDKFSCYAPPEAANERALLTNFKRFQYDCELPTRVFKQQLSRDQLNSVILLLYKQSQHSIKPFFMGTNIAVALGVPVGPVRYFASYFYVRAFLSLLALGPYRSNKFAQIIHSMYTIADFRLDIEYEARLWNIEIARFQAFIARNFAITDAVADDPIRRYAPLLATWALAASEQLLTWFCNEYIDEQGADATYVPIELPNDYPHKAIEIAEPEVILATKVHETSAELRTNIIAQLVRYMVINISYNPITLNSLTSALTEHGTLLQGIGFTSGGIVVITSSDEQLSDEQLKQIYDNLYTPIRRHYKKYDIQIINVLSTANNSPYIKFTYHADQKTLVSNEIHEDIAGHKFFELDALRKYLGSSDQTNLTVAEGSSDATNPSGFYSKKRDHSRISKSDHPDSANNASVQALFADDMATDYN